MRSREGIKVKTKKRKHEKPNYKTKTETTRKTTVSIIYGEGNLVRYNRGVGGWGGWGEYLHS